MMTDLPPAFACSDSDKIPSSKKDWICDCCGLRFKLKSLLKKHMAIHLAHTFDCLICDQKFVRADYLEEHFLHHSTEDSQSVHEKTQNLQKIDNNLYEKTIQNLTISITTLTIDHQKNPKKTGGFFHCGECFFRAATQTLFKMHIMTHLPQELACSETDKKFVRSDCLKENPKHFWRYTTEYSLKFFRRVVRTSRS